MEIYFLTLNVNAAEWTTFNVPNSLLCCHSHFVVKRERENTFFSETAFVCIYPKNKSTKTHFSLARISSGGIGSPEHV